MRTISSAVGIGKKVVLKERTITTISLITVIKGRSSKITKADTEEIRTEIIVAVTATAETTAEVITRMTVKVTTVIIRTVGIIVIALIIRSLRTVAHPR